MKTIPTESYPTLMALINETYVDGVESISSAGVDEQDNIICIGQDGNKQLIIKITDDDISIKLYKPTAAQFAESAPDLIDTYVDKMLEIDSFKPWLLQAKELLMQSSDLDDYAEKLIDLYPEMPSDDFVATMRDAMTAASLGGYFDASEDDGLDGELEFRRLGDEGINLLVDSMFDNYTLESIQLDAVASLL